MIRQTYWALLSREGFLDPEASGSDLWGARGVAVAGCLMIFTALNNFTHTAGTILRKRTGRGRALVRVAALRSRNSFCGDRSDKGE